MGSAEMPKIGQSTWLVTDRRECIDVVQAGLERIDSLHEWRQKRASNPPNSAWKWQTSA